MNSRFIMARKEISELILKESLVPLFSFRQESADFRVPNGNVLSHPASDRWQVRLCVLARVLVL